VSKKNAAIKKCGMREKGTGRAETAPIKGYKEYCNFLKRNQAWDARGEERGPCRVISKRIGRALSWRGGEWLLGVGGITQRRAKNSRVEESKEPQGGRF